MALTKKSIALLALICTAMTNAEKPFHVSTDAKELKDLEKANMIETNTNTAEVPGLNDGEIAVRATDAGLAENAKHTGNATDAGNGSASNGGTTATTAANLVTGIGFDIGAASTPRASGERYPFDGLSVGGYIFVAATADKPNPAKSLASTVSAATARYAEPIEGQTRQNRNGKTVPATKNTREFKVVPVKAGVAYGEFTAPSDGAAIVRIA